MSVTRGARYLLRNGLDYLSYQQYDRALKFLRDAEAQTKEQNTRKDSRGRKIQPELNGAEMTALKQGIEAAQRGLRRAANAESSYALSDRSRPAKGFAPAKPATRLAGRDSQPTRNVKATALPPSGLLGSDGDDEQGQPVRLASSEVPARNQSIGAGPITRSDTNGQSAVPGTTDADGPSVKPEPPPIAIVSRLPDLTAANGAQPLVATAGQNPVQSSAIATSAPDPAVNNVASTPPLINPPLSATAVLTSSGGTTPSVEQPSPLELETPPVSSAVPPPANASTRPTTQDQTPGLPISDGTVAASTKAVTPPVSAVTAAVGEPKDSIAEPVVTSPATQANAANTTIQLETPPSASTAPALKDVPTEPAASSQPNLANAAKATAELDITPLPGAAQAPSQPAIEPGGAAHQEHSDPAPASSSGAPPAASAPSPTATPESVAAPANTNDELPPLPADLSRSAPDTPTTDTPKSNPVAVETPTPTPSAEDSLPPLPADLGRSAGVTANNITESVPGTDANPSTAPADGLSTTPAPLAQPSDSTLIQPSDGASGQPTSGPTPVPAGALLQQPTTNSAEPAASSPPPATLASTAVSATSPGASALPDSTMANLSQSPSAATSSSPDAAPVAGPASSSNPAENTSAELPPVTVPSGPAESQSTASSLPSALTGGSLVTGGDALVPDRRTGPSSLKPELQREVERIARRQEEDLHRQIQNPAQPVAQPRDTIASDLRTQTQMDISRAPSPAEARPIKAIPVPEDWVPLEPRNWDPQRKYWAAAATCHLPLYFQDPVLERYGHSVEQFVGPLGRFLTYPVDDPTQSTQRNQMVQPWFSAGLMGLQIITWPYNLVMDPPWEAQYDLGYYRPGDNIPTDTYWLPLHGYGPPLRGSSY